MAPNTVTFAWAIVVGHNALSFAFASLFWISATTSLHWWIRNSISPDLHWTLCGGKKCWCVDVFILCVCVALLHAVLARDGVTVLWVVPEGHIDSNQGCPVSRQHLTPDDWRQAAPVNKHKEGQVKKQNASSQQPVISTNICPPSARVPAVWFNEC